jgi:4-hydroxyphenylacetate 3-monooxygenase
VCGDFNVAPENRDVMTFTSPKTGTPVLRAFQMPKTHADLRQRRLFSEKWAEATFGLMGRTPDHVAGFFCGYAAVPEVFAKGGQKYADNVVHSTSACATASLRQLCDRAAADRSQQTSAQADRLALYAGVVKGVTMASSSGRTAAYRRAVVAASELHPSAPTGRRELRQLPRGADQCSGLKLYPRRPFAPRRQLIRLPAVEPLR